jgi:acid phosphatase
VRKTVPLILAILFAAVGAAFAAVPVAPHVFVVLEENHSYSSVIGNSAMPYLNSLAKTYSLATQYYADTHPSIGNYFMLTTGEILTNNDSFCSTVSNDNIVRHLLSAGKTWKSYAESLPYTGYTGCNSGYYLKHHNPFAYFSDVANSSVQRNSLVPFTHFATDLANHALPQFSFIIPNVMDDAHNGSLGQADYWLKTHIGPLISSSTFQNNGLLLIVFDESFDSDTAYGGGHVVMVAVGPKVKRGYRSTLHYQHQNLLKTAMQALGVYSYPGKASSAAAMSDLF